MKNKKLVFFISLVLIVTLFLSSTVFGETYSKRTYINAKNGDLVGSIYSSKGEKCRHVLVSTKITGASIDALFAGYSLQRKGTGIELANGLNDDHRLTRNSRNAWCDWEAQTKELRTIDLVCYGVHEAYSGNSVWTVYTAKDCIG